MSKHIAALALAAFYVVTPALAAGHSLPGSNTGMGRSGFSRGDHERHSGGMVGSPIDEGSGVYTPQELNPTAPQYQPNLPTTQDMDERCWHWQRSVSPSTGIEHMDHVYAC